MSKITDFAKSGVPCIKCNRPGKDLDGGQQVYARHYNGQRQHQYGKGRGIKANDIASADFCNLCDADFQEGSVCKSNPTARDIYSEEFLHWVTMSNIRRREAGVL